MPLETHPPPSDPSSTTPSTSRLPDYHVLGSLTDVKPGTIPLLVRMPDGNCEQLDVPLHSTVDDIASSLQKDSNDVFRLSFGNNDLDPAANLLDTNIVDAYEHAGSLLHLIASGRQDADTKAAALDSACAVVETISNGIKDMEALCAAAMPDHPDQSDRPHSPEPNREDPSQVERTDLKSLQNSSGATPSQLAYNLSRRLPNLFPPSGTAAAFPSDDADQPSEQSEQQTTQQPSLGRQVSFQPSLSNIRDARRRASELRKAEQDDRSSKGPARVPDITIGESTNVPLPLDLENPTESQQREGGSSLMLANSGKTTWLEDVMKTWEVDTVRESGVLEKSKDGQEISTYLQSLEDEAERETEVEKIETEQQASATKTTSIPGDSSDDDGDTNQLGDTSGNASTQTTPVPNGDTNDTGDSATNDLQKSIAAVNISDRDRSDPAAQMLMAQSAASAAVMTGNTTPDPPRKDAGHASHPFNQQSQRHESQNARRLISQQARTQQPQQPQPVRGSQPSQQQQRPPGQQTPPPQLHLQLPAQSSKAVFSDAPNSSGSSSSSVLHQTERPMCYAIDLKSKPPIRQATKIAPAPNLANSPVAGANGLFGNQVYPGAVPLPGPTWTPKPGASGPKKRGRKRKNPELTEEERALARKEQNRESAKLSRVRRKVIAAEYEGRLNALIEENTMLRKQVEGLNNRLVYLQSLLTISVRQEPSSS